MMKYSKQEVMQYVQEEDVKFVRLSFCGAIRPAKKHLHQFGGSSLARLNTALPLMLPPSPVLETTHSDLLLHPEPETLAPLPWRPEHGRVVRMFTRISHPDGAALCMRHEKNSETGGRRCGTGRIPFFLWR